MKKKTRNVFSIFILLIVIIGLIPLTSYLSNGFKDVPFSYSLLINNKKVEKFENNKIYNNGVFNFVVISSPSTKISDLKIDISTKNFLLYKANGEDINLMWTQVFDKAYYLESGKKVINKVFDINNIENGFSIDFNDVSMNSVIEILLGHSDVIFENLNNNSDYFNMRIYSENSRIEFNYSFSFINAYLNFDMQEVIF